MSEALIRIAETAHHWGRRDDLSANDRDFAHQVAELAFFLSRRPFPHEDDVGSLHILGCRLCRKVGAASCGERADNCCLGLAATN